MANKKSALATDFTANELAELREQLFGVTLRKLENKQKTIQQEVNVGLAESDQMTNQRLDNMMRRLDAIEHAITQDHAARQNQARLTNDAMSKALMKLASEQSAALARESHRVDQAIARERKRIDAVLKLLQPQLAVERTRKLDSLRRNVSAEHARLSQNIQSLSDVIDRY